jgi:large subunit ribosomal protein L29
MKATQVRDMSDSELQARLGELVEELFHLRLRKTTSQLSNPMKVRETRRDVARLRTVLRQRAVRSSGGPA